MPALGRESERERGREGRREGRRDGGRGGGWVRARLLVDSGSVRGETSRTGRRVERCKKKAWCLPALGGRERARERQREREREREREICSELRHALR